MNDILYRARCAASRFMYGRNGIDRLGVALLILEGVLCLLSFFLTWGIAGAALRLLSLLLTAALVYRFLSRDLGRRRAENARFLHWSDSIAGGMRDWRARRTDKTHRYTKCSCGAWCRVPRGVGRVELICPCCGAKKTIKT